MLIFFLDLSPTIAASYSPDNFVDKLVVEARQIFSAALSHFYPRAGKPYGYAHHPFTLWIMQSEWAWNWLVEYCRACAEKEKIARFPQVKKRERPLNSAWYWIRDEMPTPPFWRYRTQEETPPMPLPDKVKFGDTAAKDHEEVVARMRLYHLLTKWESTVEKPKWQYLYRFPAFPPAYLPVSEKQKEKMTKKRKIKK